MSLNPIFHTAVETWKREKKLHLILKKFMSKADFYDHSRLCPEE